ARDCAIHHRLHQFSPHAEVLRAGIDSDRPNPGYGRTLVQAVAPHDAASVLRYHAVEAGIAKHHRKHADGGFGPGKIAREPVFRVEFRESFVANLTTDGAVIRRCGT